MTKHIVHITTSIEKSCEHCTTQVGGDRFAESVNHYIENHGYKLLHVGTETTHDMNGSPWQVSVAVVGK